MPGVKVLGAWSLPKDATSISGNLASFIWGLNPKPSKIGNCLLDSNNLEVPQLWETPMSNTVGQCYILGIHTLGHLERERVSERGRDCTIFTKRT